MSAVGKAIGLGVISGVEGTVVSAVQVGRAIRVVACPGRAVRVVASGVGRAMGVILSAGGRVIRLTNLLQCLCIPGCYLQVVEPYKSLSLRLEESCLVPPYDLLYLGLEEP